MPLRYWSGEEIRKGDPVRFHGEPGEIEFVAKTIRGDPLADWSLETNGPGVMIIEPKFAAHRGLEELVVRHSIRISAILVVTVLASSGCGNVTDTPEWAEHATRILEIHPGMSESDVRMILGVPSKTLTGSALSTACGASGSSSAVVYDFVLATRLQKAVVKILREAEPPVSHFTVCMDPDDKVTKTRDDTTL